MHEPILFPLQPEDPDPQTLSHEDLAARIAQLRDAIAALDAREPEDMMSRQYARWGEQHEELEDALEDLLELLDG